MQLTEEKRKRLEGIANFLLKRESMEIDLSESKKLIESFRDMLLGKIELDLSILDSKNILFNDLFKEFISQVLSALFYDNYHNPIVMKILETVFQRENSYYVWRFLDSVIPKDYTFLLLNHLFDNGYEKELIFTDTSLWTICQNFPERNYTPSAKGAFLINKMKEESLDLRPSGDHTYYQMLFDITFHGRYIDSLQIEGLGMLLHLVNPTSFFKVLQKYIFTIRPSDVQVNYKLIDFLLSENQEFYAEEIIGLVLAKIADVEKKYPLYVLLVHYNKAKYLKPCLAIGEEYLSRCCSKTQPQLNDVHVIGAVSGLIHYFDLLLDSQPDLFAVKIFEFIDNSRTLGKHVLKFLDDKFGPNVVPILSRCFENRREYLDENGTIRLMACLASYDYTEDIPAIIDYAVSYAGKKAQEAFAEHVANHSTSIRRAVELVKSKKVKERKVGALILSKLSEDKLSENVSESLNSAIDSEPNDELRNLMLESVKETRFSKALDLDEVRSMIVKADKRNKLKKWNEKRIDEATIPALYWKDGKQCDVTAIRFLFYRLSLTKAMSSDLEAREMIRHIDKEKAEAFAENLLQTFAQGRADIKLKYYLTLCGLLGQDNILSKLNTLFRSSIANKRSKLAEYILGAIAMIGSDKALRYLELISRKYASKKPSLSNVAVLSLNAAAQELGITKDQLADRIIPNFDFDGTYREIEIEGETYRTYFNSEFRLIYTDESGKSRKSLPRGASPELKKEFKVIEKEVKVIVKSQEDRLQRYMIAGRTWKAEDWEIFFFNNPIMFIYATQLLWVKVDEQAKVIEVFYCDEDGEMFNFEDEEVEIEANDKICILHPCNLTDEQLQQWKNKAFEDELKTIFPILDREIVRKLPEELALNTSIRFNKQEIPRGADYTVSYMNRKGYIKSTEDGGYLQYRKELTTPAITVFPNIEGPAAWYQNNEAKAFIHEINFRGKKYTDDVTIADVPDAFYSEIMVDMKNLIEDQV